MSTNWVKDIQRLHTKFGVRERVDTMTEEEKKMFLEFRVKFLEEELTELRTNANNPEEIVDACIDLCVVAIGTLDAFGVDASKAWNEVHKANMAKEIGIKNTRPNPLGLPDLIKPKGWVAPSHEGNHGKIVPTKPMLTFFERVRSVFSNIIS